MSTGLQQNDKKKHYLMLCELHYPAIHGKTKDSDPFIERHYLVYDRFDPRTGISYSCLSDYEEYDTDTEYDSDEDDNQNRVIKLNDSMAFLQKQYSNPVNFHQNNFGNHPTIRNYHNIISSPNYIKPEIGEYIILPTQESVAILKTFWIRIIQRKWKQIFKNRQLIIKNRCSPSKLYVREITGSWSYKYNELPGLRGMLNNLNQM